jgi:hypothetical protein
MRVRPGFDDLLSFLEMRVKLLTTRGYKNLLNSKLKLIFRKEIQTKIKPRIYPPFTICELDYHT